MKRGDFALTKSSEKVIIMEVNNSEKYAVVLHMTPGMYNPVGYNLEELSPWESKNE